MENSEKQNLNSEEQENINGGAVLECEIPAVTAVWEADSFAPNDSVSVDVFTDPNLPNLINLRGEASGKKSGFWGWLKNLFGNF